MIYMFDMDGTLTPARKPMEQGFYRNRLGYCQSFGTASVGCRQCFFGNILRHGQ